MEAEQCMEEWSSRWGNGGVIKECICCASMQKKPAQQKKPGARARKGGHLQVNKFIVCGRINKGACDRRTNEQTQELATQELATGTPDSLP